MSNIVMLVRNSVSKDARVLKEASSLGNRGYRVAILGIKDNDQKRYCDKLSSRVTIKRLPWRTNSLRFLSWMLAVVFIAASVFLVMSEPSKVKLIAVLTFIFFIGISYLTSRISIYSKIESDGEGKLLNNNIKRNALLKKIRKPITFLNNLISSFRFVVLQLSALYGHGKSILIEVDRIKPDIIHAHDISTLPIGVYIKKRYGIPLIYDAHEMYEDAVGVSKFASYFYKIINIFSQKHIDGFITINESFCDIYKNKYPKLPQPTLIMNATKYSPPFVYDGRLHRATNLDISIKIILFQGGFSNRRGIQNLLDVAPVLDDGWCIVFMGWGLLESDIQAKNIDFPDKIKLIPPAPQDELVFWTAGAFVGVIPYEDAGINHTYCTPNKLWEYPNAGVPIVVTPRLEMKAILKRHNLGKLISEPVSANDLAKTLMLSEQEHAKYSINCRIFAENESWSKYEQNIYSLYEDLAASR